MRLIFINRYFHPDLSATAQLLSDLAFYLAARGHDVSVLTSRQAYGDAAADYPTRETIRGVQVIRCRGTRFGRANLLGRALDYLSFYVSVFAGALKIARAGDIVVATTDPPLLGLVLQPAVRLRRAKLVNWLHDMFPEIAAHSPVHGLGTGVIRLLQSARNRNCRAATCNVVLGQRMYEYLRTQSVPVGRLEIIPNWAPEGLLPFTLQTNLLRADWHLAEKFVVGYAGNMGRVHEFETLLGAAQRLQHEPQIAFLFVGGGARLNAVRNRVAGLGLPNVSFQDYQPRERLAESLSVADLHVVSLNPEFEALVVPSKIYGIAAVGRPVVFIGEADGEIASLVRTHGFGHCVTCGDAQELATLIKQIAANKPDLLRMGTQATQAHRQHFAAEHTLARWEALLASLGQPSTPTAP